MDLALNNPRKVNMPLNWKETETKSELIKSARAVEYTEYISA